MFVWKNYENYYIYFWFFECMNKQFDQLRYYVLNIDSIATFYTSVVNESTKERVN